MIRKVFFASLLFAAQFGAPALGQGLGGSVSGAAPAPAQTSPGISALPAATVPAAPVITNAPLPGGREAPAAADKPSSPTADKAPAPVGDFAERNEFQDFVAQSVGRPLPMFGYRLFSDAPSTFAPVDHVPVGADYVVGPGDEIIIRGWGQVDIDYRAVVDRDGTISIPKVGVINVSGVTYQDLPGHIKTAVGRVFRGFDLSVSLGQLRSVQVFVVGQARRPGSYTVGSLSTLVNALFASGGPSAKGSMRKIQLKRGGRVVTEFDVYDLLVRGDKSRDARLQNGDVIYIPPIGKLVALAGSVNTPAIYELKDKGSLGELIETAGGLTTTASAQKATVERIAERKARRVDEFALDAAGLARSLQDGDLVQIFAVSPRFDNAVTLRGNVANPGRFPWREGMRVRDLIPDRDMLIVPEYWLKQNAAPRVEIVGSERLRTEVKHSVDEINWDYAVVERLNADDLTPTLVPFNLGRAVLEADATQNLLLRPGDVVTVFSKGDIAVPAARRTKFVVLAGEFPAAGVYQIQPGETLRQLVARAGGLTPNAYLFGASFTREATRADQQRQLEEYIDRLQADIERNLARSASSAVSADEATGARTAAESQRQLVAKLRQIKASGRIVLEIPPALNGQLNDLPDIALEDGDRLSVPARPATVGVYGAVYSSSTFLFKGDKRVSDYVQQAGGPTRDADDDSIYVLRADGSVVSKRQSGWLTGFSGERLMPGDAVVVPDRLDKYSLTKELKDWSQIIYQFSLGVAGLKVLRDL